MSPSGYHLIEAEERSRQLPNILQPCGSHSGQHRFLKVLVRDRFLNAGLSKSVPNLVMQGCPTFYSEERPRPYESDIEDEIDLIVASGDEANVGFADCQTGLW